MNIEKMSKEELSALKGKFFKIQDGTNRSGVIMSTKGLHFPLSEPETEGGPTGKHLEVQLNDGRKLRDPEKIFEDTIRFVEVM